MAKTKISRSSIKKYSKNKKYFSKGGSRGYKRSSVAPMKFPNTPIDEIRSYPEIPMYDPELSKLTAECDKKNTLIDDIKLEILKTETKLADTKKLLKDAKVAQKISCDALNNKRKEITRKSAASATGIFAASSAVPPTKRLSKG